MEKETEEEKEEEKKKHLLESISVVSVYTKGKMMKIRWKEEIGGEEENYGFWSSSCLFMIYCGRSLDYFFFFFLIFLFCT